MKQTLMKLDTLNKNGRIYTTESVNKAIQEANDKSEKGQLLGELGYGNVVDIDLKNVSHKISELKIEDNSVVGEIEILDTPSGNKLKDILDQVVFRPRGTGNINDKGEVENFKIISFDAISKHEDAFK